MVSGVATITERWKCLPTPAAAPPVCSSPPLPPPAPAGLQSQSVCVCGCSAFALWTCHPWDKTCARSSPWLLSLSGSQKAEHAYLFRKLLLSACQGVG